MGVDKRLMTVEEPYKGTLSFKVPHQNFQAKHFSFATVTYFTELFLF
jgi:hypothetical protein